VHQIKAVDKGGVKQPARHEDKQRGRPGLSVHVKIEMEWKPKPVSISHGKAGGRKKN